MKRRNIYKHSIELKELTIKNAEREKFIEKLEQVPYRGYEVENISDGRKVVIAKPGGKRGIYGKIKKEGFFVFIFTPPDELWQITHSQIYEDLKKKSEFKPTHTMKILKALEKVYNGEELDDTLVAQLNSGNQIGESPEATDKSL